MKRLILLAAATAMTGIAATPAAAQETGNERIMMVTIPEGEECPSSDDPNTIVVCETMNSGDQYRIPSNLRRSTAPENDSWAVRARELETIGDTGVRSCSNVGGSAGLGCTQLMIEDAEAERAAAPEVRFSQQIEEARQERLATIDGEAARTQARVEELERAYIARLEAERDAPLPGEEDEALPTLEVVDPDSIPQRPPSAN